MARSIVGFGTLVLDKPLANAYPAGAVVIRQVNTQLPTGGFPGECSDTSEASVEIVAMAASIAAAVTGGHSYAGPTALIAAATRPELFKGLVLHDPATTDAPKPTLPVFSVVGDQYANIGPLAKEVRRVSTGQVTTSAVQQTPGLAWAGAWQYVGISHGNFVDAPLWAPLLIMRALGLLLIPAAGPADPAEAHARLAASAAIFSRSCCSVKEGSRGLSSASPDQQLPGNPFLRL